MTEEGEKIHSLFLPTAVGWSSLLHAVSFRGMVHLEKLWGILAWLVTRWINWVLEYSIKKPTVTIELSQTPHTACWSLSVGLMGLSLYHCYICRENRESIYCPHKTPKVNGEMFYGEFLVDLLMWTVHVLPLGSEQLLSVSLEDNNSFVTFWITCSNPLTTHSWSNIDSTLKPNLGICTDIGSG